MFKNNSASIGGALSRPITGSILFCLFLSSSAFADQVVLKNGDRLTGSIVKKDGDDLVIKSDLFGTVTTKWAQVDSVSGETPVHVVESDGKTIEVPVSNVNTMMADVKAIRNADEQRAFERLENPGLTDLWTGAAQIGWAGARETRRPSHSRPARDHPKRQDLRVLQQHPGIFTCRWTTSKTAEAIRGGIGYDRNIGGRLFLTTFNDYEYDRFQSLDLRVVAGGGLGFHLLARERTKLDVVAGGAYNRSAFTTFTRKSAEAYYGDDLEHKFGKSTTVYQTARIFHDLTHTGQYRVNFDAGAAVKVASWLTWNLAVSDRYLNTPAPGENRTTCCTRRVSAFHLTAEAAYVLYSSSTLAVAASPGWITTRN